MADVLDPRDLIDRKAERELFGELVSFTSSARMLTIGDTGGRGKSALLRRLKYNCQYEIKPQVSACLIDLSDLHDAFAFSLVSTMVDQFSVSTPFARFKQLDEARRLKDFSVFAQGAKTDYRDPRSLPQIQATATVAESTGEGSTVAGIHANYATFNVAQSPEFTDEQEQLARQRCVEAFLEDLRVISATQPLAIIFDAWERCNLPLRAWIRDEFFAKQCFNPDPNLRPDKLAIVVAGRPHNPADAPFGLRQDDFRPLFKDDQEHVKIVLSIRSLSEWGYDHVREFMILNGCREPDEDAIRFIQSKLKANWSLEKILQFIDDYLLE